MLRFFLLLAAFVMAAPLRAEAVAEGQNEADYHAWLARSPAARA
ncbi:hypothetical protein [Allosphingosinicella humi]